uniref:Ig-like domain-containing protein n=1 Tax=Neogobius melanostomus TaxID=47308 RepID=A0A8C6U8C1_9GOBI
MLLKKRKRAVLQGVYDFLMAVVAHSYVNQDRGVTSVSVGDSVTLHCYYNITQVASHHAWYRQTLGGSPTELSTLYKFDTPPRTLVWLEKHPRFSVQRQEGQNHLHISGVQPQDSALYFCGSSHNNKMEFGHGVFLNVQESSSRQVTQEPELETTEPGSSVMLNCSVKPGACSEEHSVYWFRYGSGLGLLHTDGDQCTAGLKSGPPSCTYHLQKANVSRADAGTYYCAVASCGHILFGTGTVVKVSGDDGDPDVHLRVLVWLSIVRTGAMLMLILVCLLTYCIRRR